LTDYAFLKQFYSIYDFSGPDMQSYVSNRKQQIKIETIVISWSGISKENKKQDKQ
jgi:hypothetical protein